MIPMGRSFDPLYTSASCGRDEDFGRCVRFWKIVYANKLGDARMGSLNGKNSEANYINKLRGSCEVAPANNRFTVYIYADPA